MKQAPPFLLSECSASSALDMLRVYVAWPFPLLVFTLNLSVSNHRVPAA
jgi:hypothetical protein